MDITTEKEPPERGSHSPPKSRVRANRPIHRYTDERTKIARGVVPLDDEGKRNAIVDIEDYERLIASGVTPTWSADSNGKYAKFYVRCAVTGLTWRKVAVARLILNAVEGDVVNYKNGNTLDLTQENLCRGRGKAKRNDSYFVAARQLQVATKRQVRAVL